MKRVVAIGLGVLGFGFWFGSMLLLGRATEGADEFGRLYGSLFLLNAIGVITLIVLIAVNLVRLVRDYRSRMPGSRLKSRMVATFVILSVVPLVIVFYFSVQFLNRGIDSWFSVDVEKGLSDALNLSRATLEIQMRDYLSATEEMAIRLQEWNPAELAGELARLQRQSGAVEITVIGSNSRIVASISDREELDVIATPTEEILLQLAQGRSYVGLDPLGTSGYQIRTAAMIPMPSPFSEQRMLLGIFPVSERLSSLADAVQHAYSDYGELSYLRRLLKYSLTLTLTLVLLLSLLTAVWGAFFFSRKLVAPIQNLIAGTRAVAQGDYDTQLPLPGNDDMGFLVRSFNEMTRRLSEARRLASASQATIENERAYLSIILGRLSTGVISLETDWRVRTANQAAGSILGFDLESGIGRPLLEIARESSLLEQFVDVARRHIMAGDSEWREQIVLKAEGGRRVLVCACSGLSSESGEIAGYVMVFDDITALMQAQRDAAWGEVARRLAHEIKNPLTPIQLSAERMRRRLLDRIEEKDAQVVERATRTIVQQVEAMKEMVNAFSEYARAPDMDLITVDLNHLVSEVADLYRAREIDVTMDLDLDPELGSVEIDPGRVRQILHNLIGNSVEALDHKKDARLWIRTALETEGEVRLLSIVIEDNGPGFPLDAIEYIFDPYVTSKPKGTGLGLAIVKKLVEEHGGRADAENREEGGARMSIVMPVDDEARTALLRKEAHSTDYKGERA
ncbi:MAG: HAMP domain-containing protein [Gammaproteobacteria bacterium]|nr:MAG: HAMP domain-containing protein [Gammaproteobacteria bacterium]